MNFKLIFLLSLFGLVMAIATVFWIPTKIEPYFWLAIFIFSAYVIAKKAPGKFFIHGFLVSLMNCIWITGIHVTLYDQYLAFHPEDVKRMAELNTSMSPRMLMLVTGPIIGIITGLILGLFSFVASKLIKR